MIEGKALTECGLILSPQINNYLLKISASYLFCIFIILEEAQNVTHLFFVVYLFLTLEKSCIKNSFNQKSFKEKRS